MSGRKPFYIGGLSPTHLPSDDDDYFQHHGGGAVHSGAVRSLLDDVSVAMNDGQSTDIENVDAAIDRDNQSQERQRTAESRESNATLSLTQQTLDDHSAAKRHSSVPTTVPMSDSEANEPDDDRTMALLNEELSVDNSDDEERAEQQPHYYY